MGEEGFECWDYEDKKWGRFGFSPIESFHSLLKANGVLLENDVKKPIPNLYDTDNSEEKHALEKAMLVYKEAEAKVFNPKTTLIFVGNE